MTKDEILNRIAIECTGKHFNQIFDIKVRATILQDALDEVIGKLNHTTKPIESHQQQSERIMRGILKM